MSALSRLKAWMPRSISCCRTLYRFRPSGGTSIVLPACGENEELECERSNCIVCLESTKPGFWLSHLIALLITQFETTCTLRDVYFHAVPTRRFLGRVITQTVLVTKVRSDRMQDGR